MLHILFLFLFGVLGDSGNQATWEFRLPTSNQVFARRNVATGKVSALNNSIFQLSDAVTFGFEPQLGPHCELVEDYVLCFVFQGQWQMHKYDIHENNWKFIQNFEQVDAVRYLDGFLFVISGNHFKKCDVLSWRCTILKIGVKDVLGINDATWRVSTIVCPPINEVEIPNHFSWLFYLEFTFDTTPYNGYYNGYWEFNLRTNFISRQIDGGNWGRYQDCSKRIWKGSRLLPDFPIAKHYQDWELQKVIERLETSLENAIQQREQDITKLSKHLQDSNLVLTKQSIEISELQKFVFIWNFVGLVVLCVVLWFLVVGLIRHFILKAVIDG
jgi:hypothetical protein